MSLHSLALVISQFSLIFLIIWNGQMVHWDLTSLSVQLLGIFIALWGIYNIKIRNFNIQPEAKSEVLVTKGIFNILRNPMYTGILLVFLPVVIRGDHLFPWIYYVLLIVVLILKIYKEEAFLKEKFGQSYTVYKARTWRILPYIF
ncbi:methyltransferase family protein [Dokdonia sp. 4H-3-7-5]|uniref:methyltransferase family protein n=1 Tax=Dokdonia sp. (strain 4H-3-7-5) TaxID=983548 RepID=UPI00020A6A57|nr:isoprenylcysteine carboxylmethyltransferase family protein [Dokdonia sp. 4H-3-7-5]AEE20709.1 hypothetical protein Krodi_2734 [Dokdonia sp. 4H-3-7-5]